MVTRDELIGGHWPPAAGRRSAATVPALRAHVRSLAPAARQHPDPAALGQHGHLGAPRAARRTTASGLMIGLILTVLLGMLFTSIQAYEYAHAAFSYAGPHLRLDLLHGDRLPRLPRDHRHDLPDRLPDPRARRRTSRPSSTSASRRRPGTGTSSTWCGCSCSPASTSGALGPTPAATSANRADRSTRIPATGRPDWRPVSFAAASVSLSAAVPDVLRFHRCGEPRREPFRLALPCRQSQKPRCCAPGCSRAARAAAAGRCFATCSSCAKLRRAAA